jgi:hypothetical protein
MVGTRDQGSQDQEIERALRKIEALLWHMFQLCFYRNNTTTPVEVQGSQIIYWIDYFTVGAPRTDGYQGLTSRSPFTHYHRFTPQSRIVTGHSPFNPQQSPIPFRRLPSRGRCSGFFKNLKVP